jgi:hypothetical protein
LERGLMSWIFAKKIAEKMSISTQITAVKKRQLFRRKSQKIPSDHNIDPC